MSNDLGPGLGTLIGLKWASVNSAKSGRAKELNAMREELRRTLAGGLYDDAFALAAAELTSEMLEELKAEQAGQPGARRLSDPANVDARNEVYVNRAAANVRKMSKGLVYLSKEDQKRIRAERPIR